MVGAALMEEVCDWRQALRLDPISVTLSAMLPAVVEDVISWLLAPVTVSAACCHASCKQRILIPLEP